MLGSTSTHVYTAAKMFPCQQYAGNTGQQLAYPHSTMEEFLESGVFCAVCVLHEAIHGQQIGQVNHELQL
jgi:hypothetical protein